MSVGSVNFRVLPSGIAIPADAATMPARAVGAEPDQAADVHPHLRVMFPHANRANGDLHERHDPEYGGEDRAA